MIIGIGSDIVSIARISRLLIVKRDAFLKKIFTSPEIVAINKILHKDKIAGYVANRFAAKEAFAKAIGVGIGKHVSFQDVAIFKTKKGKPYFKFSEKLTKHLHQEYGNNLNIHLTMANEKEHAQAFVIIEQLILG